MKVGSLVKTSSWRYLTLYPDEQTAIEHMFFPATKHKRCSSFNLKENVSLLVLRIGVDERLMEVLAGEQKGWIIRYPHMIFRPVR